MNFLTADIASEFYRRFHGSSFDDLRQGECYNQQLKKLPLAILPAHVQGLYNNALQFATRDSPTKKETPLFLALPDCFAGSITKWEPAQWVNQIAD